MKKFNLVQLVFSIILLSFSSNLALAQKNISSYLTKINQSLYYLNQFYLDTVNFDNISDKAIFSIVKELDPHSAYIPAKDVKAMNEPLEGNFDGIGVEFAIINDTLAIQSVIPSGPSEKVGIRAGDKIIKVDNELIAGTGLTIERIHKYLRGPKGTKVLVDIKRKDSDKLLEFLIVRDKIPINSIDSYYKVTDDIAYIRLTRFSATSYKELMEAISKMNGGIKGIILDLRSNPGGYLVTALQIANEFLERGNLILYTEGRSVKRMDEYATGSGSLKNVEVAVLIDENSASASEIISGAIQDWDRGCIIGRRSFGKGLVQQQMPLVDGSQLRLTVARYHTPSGRVIQSPYKPGKADEYYKQLYDRFVRGEQFNKEEIQFPDSLKYKTLKLGRTVYGGGGIMPDIFVAQDTSFYTPFYGKIIRNQVLTDFVNDYVDKHRDKLLKQYKSFSEFEKLYFVSDSDFDKFIKYCVSKDIKPEDKDIEISGGEIKKYFKGLIIRSLYGFNNFIEYLNLTDKEVDIAIKELQKKL